MKYAIQNIKSRAWWDGDKWGIRQDRKLYEREDLPLKIEAINLFFADWSTPEKAIGGYEYVYSKHQTPVATLVRVR